MNDIEILSTKAQTFLRTAEQVSSIGDYGVSLSVTREETEDLLEAAKDFVQKVRSYLDAWAEKEGRQ